MIHSELHDGVRLLTLDRSDVLNAFDLDQFELLAERLIEAHQDPATKVLVLTGAGVRLLVRAALRVNSSGVWWTAVRPSACSFVRLAPARTRRIDG